MSIENFIYYVYVGIAWILTRAQSPSASVIDTALEVLRQNNINLGPLSLTNQSNC